MNIFVPSTQNTVSRIWQFKSQR